MTIYSQNTDAFLYATFVDNLGEEATISGTPTVTVYHKNGTTTVIDVNAQNMTQLTGSTWYYQYHIVTGADKTDYVARFSATYADGTSALGESAFLVVGRRFYEGIRAGGLVQKPVEPIWNEEEKAELLKSIASLKKSLEDIISISNILAEKDTVDNVTFGSVGDKLDKIEKEVVNIKMSTTDYSTKEQMSLLVDELNNIHEMVSKDATERKQSEISLKLDALESDINELAKVIIKIMPTDKMEEILNVDKENA